MTITDVKRLHGSGKIQYAKGSQYAIPFEVSFTNGWAEAALILNSDARLPKIGMTLGQESGSTSTDTSVYADSIAVGLLSDEVPYGIDSGGHAANGLALYTVAYEQITPGWAINPLSRVDVQWGGAEDVETVKYDVDGNAIVNSAGELYSPLPTRPIRGSECTITIRMTANPASIVTLYSYSTNASAIWGVSAENALMGKVQARYVQEGVGRYWELGFPIKFRRDSWRLKLIDNGSVFLNDDGDQQSATDDVGQQKQTAVLLDGSGNELAPDADPVIFPDNGYEINDKMDWSELDLPNPFTWTGN